MTVNKEIEVLKMIGKFLVATTETTAENDIPGGKDDDMSGEKSVSEKPYWMIPAALGCFALVVLVSIGITFLVFARRQRRKRKKQSAHREDNTPDISEKQAPLPTTGFQQGNVNNATTDESGGSVGATTVDETQRSVSESDAQDVTQKTVNETAETQDDATEGSAKLQSDTTNKEAEESSKTHETRQQFRPESSLRTDQTNLSTPLATEETEEESTLVNSTTYNKTPLRKHSSFTYPISA